MTTIDGKIRASEFRAYLEELHNELAQAHKLTGGLHGTDITKNVDAYIKTGMSFTEAEELLKAAGFTVGKRPSSVPPEINRAKDWYAIVANISPSKTKF
ncbi:PASTA domain-containing protein [Beijerinckia indica]|uniref:PASTA domain-containing protein n=1 Tax=Beijerinckia indica TaxID=533 RepID=UPI0011D17530|nr:PASTA domain-containing protein [Beijerinckia indica]